MIPKVIHYCWFGRGKLPELALKCIDSWRKYMPDYEIKEWNEDNFDVNMIPYTRDAYAAKKYAYVSDFARFWILYEYGGVYFDTDVELLRDLEPILAMGPYMGCENYATDGDSLRVAPGLGIACNPGHKAYKDIINIYKNTSFVIQGADGKNITIVQYTSAYFFEHGLKNLNEIQTINGIKIYPADYFAPRINAQHNIPRTENSYSVHHYMGSWLPKQLKYKYRILKLLPRSIVRCFIKLKSKIKS